jgi:hypothetical protein
MGLEATCTAVFKRARSEGQAQLETDFILFRGDFRVKLPFAAIARVSVVDGTLSLESADGTLALQLGPLAEKWATKISKPKSLVEKLGIKPESLVSVVGLRDGDLVQQLEAAGAQVRLGRAAKGSQTIIVAVNTADDLRRFSTLLPSLAAGGAFWSIRPKGQPDVSEANVRAAAKAAGLTDVKVARVSDTHTAEKFVRRA